MNFRLGILLPLPLAMPLLAQSPVPANFPQPIIWGMSLTDLLTIAAVVLGPILAVQVQWRLQIWREKRERKVYLFKTLMATRATALALSHVEALNSIEVEFYGKKKQDKNVVDAWKLYLDHLGTQRKAPDDAVWDDRVVALQTDLLFEMAKSCGYQFDKVTIKRNAYRPSGHGLVEEELHALRRGLLQLVMGGRTLKMEVTSIPVDEEFVNKQKQLTELSLAAISGKRPMPVTIVNEESKVAGAPESNPVAQPSSIQPTLQGSPVSNG